MAILKNKKKKKENATKCVRPRVAIITVRREHLAISAVFTTVICMRKRPRDVLTNPNECRLTEILPGH